MKITQKDRVLGEGSVAGSEVYKMTGSIVDENYVCRVEFFQSKTKAIAHLADESFT